MAKKLSDMTLQELWELFPIILTEHQPQWHQWYEEEAAILKELLPLCAPYHIGSTAIPGIWAKPIVDILLEAPEGATLQEIKAVLLSGGWICMSEEPGRLSFNKGYTPQGFAQRVFHLHLRRQGDTSELLFRDYLLSHPDAARAYEKLKLSLWKPYEHDRDGYTAAKTEFVSRITRQAAEEQAGTTS